MKVHVIEDEVSIQKATSFYLENDGFKVTKSIGGEKAVEETLAANPDVIVLDIMLPGKSGYDVLKELREKGCKAPVVVFTNLSVEELDHKKLDKLNVEAILLKVETDLEDLSDRILAIATKRN